MERSKFVSENNQLWLRTNIINDSGCSNIYQFKIEEVLCDCKTQFQNVLILRTSQFGDMLILDGDIQSSQCDEFIYHESLVHPAMVGHANPARVLIIGGGEGATLREVLRYSSVQEVVMVDIDRELIEICKKLLPSWHQGSFEDVRVKVLHQDGKEYLNQCKQKFDVIFMDLCEEVEGPIAELYKLDFFELLKSHLAPDGVLSMQASYCFGSLIKKHLNFRSILGEIFPTVESYFTFVPSSFWDWGFILAHNSKSIASIVPQEIDLVLDSKKINPKLKYYDGITHRRIFCLPKNIRSYLSKECGSY